MTRICIVILMLVAGIPVCHAQDQRLDAKIDSLNDFDNNMSSKYFSKSKFNPDLEDNILDKVWDLPEVKRRDEYLKHVSKGKRYLGIVVYQRHISENDYYWIKVGEDFGGLIITHFDFYVEPKTLTVKYYDAEKGMIVDLATWRKTYKE